MEKHPIQTLLRARYDPKYLKLSDLIVIIRHRGAPNDRKEIDGERIVSVKKDGFWYENEFGKKIFIPAHRIIEIRFKN